MSAPGIRQQLAMARAYATEEKAVLAVAAKKLRGDERAANLKTQDSMDWALGEFDRFEKILPMVERCAELDAERQRQRAAVDGGSP